MSCLQITACGLNAKSKTISPYHRLSAVHSRLPANYAIQLLGTPSRLASNASRYQKCTIVCLFGGKGKPDNDNDAPSRWKSREKAMGGLRREKSVQDLLREQMQKQEFADGGGGPGGPPSSGGGDGGGSEDEGIGGILDEMLQVILATVALLLLYVYIIKGEELTLLAKDSIIYLFTRRKSLRIEHALENLGRCYPKPTKKKVDQGDWLERAILNTPTWWSELGLDEHPRLDELGLDEHPRLDELGVDVRYPSLDELDELDEVNELDELDEVDEVDELDEVDEVDELDEQPRLDEHDLGSGSDSSIDSF